MKKHGIIAKALSVILAIVVLVPAANISALAAHCDNVPYVYIEGRKEIIFRHEDGTVTMPLEEDDKLDYAGMAKALVPSLLKSFASGDWTDFGDKFYEVVAPIWKDVKVDKNGFPENPNTGIVWSWSPDRVSANHSRGMYAPYIYRYDCRLSPMDVADDIHEYIETIKAKTGHDKVNIVARCLGASYAMAYIYKYEMPVNYAGINRFFLLSGTHYGTAYSTALLTGTIEFDAKSFTRYVHTSKNTENLEQDELGKLFVTMLDMLSETHSSDIAFNMVTTMYNKIKDTVLAPIVREYYGTVGMSLSCISDNRLEEALDYVFPTEELREEYAVIIAKARAYNEVYNSMEDMLCEMDALGIPTFTIAQYGFQQNPYAGARSALIGDNTVGLMEQSNGATVSFINSTLSQKYIDERIAAGYEKYISVDKQVDASTCLFPDRTWFIKNMDHHFPKTMDRMIEYLANTAEAPTVNSNPAYPQFMNAIPLDGRDENFSFVPLQEVNPEDMDWNAIENTGGAATLNMFERILNYILSLFDALLKGITDIIDHVKAPVTK